MNRECKGRDLKVYAFSGAYDSLYKVFVKIVRYE
jgi:hypothetical protein